MITREQIPAVLEHPVYDAEGHKIGAAKNVYLDDATGRPEWATVKTGMFGGEHFVPLEGAAMVQDHLAVAYSKNKVKEAPEVSLEAGGHLSAQQEHRLYDYYGLDWDAAWQRTDEAAGTAGTAGVTGTAGAAGTAAGAAGAAGTAEEAERRRAPEAAPTEGRAAAGPTDDAMTRSEEHLRVGKERYRTGRVRLRKYVVTEEEQATIPVRKEEARIEREPITPENRGEAVSGPEISEAEYEVTLHEERPVVDTEVEPKERVRLTTEEHTEDETVRGTVRKEQIRTETDETGEVESPEEEPPRPGEPGGPADPGAARPY
ncbi:DUF2382 domain-containing protein [Streptomyces aidingensis]|uniref:Conserved domain-containing protein n=1 Tax=Streptomyces aidingensis TaxID=910347 RepID=A0A1I1KL01_9ACTN|nr:PRC and DUF2382 domain-containing protein [Streptomyces aidingensis]SFC58803.1 conserved domain-containing protein [Streptomyces aidingensis]